MNYTSFKEYILNNIGDEWHNIEVSDNQFQNIVGQCVKKHAEYHYDGTNIEVYPLTILDSTTVYTLPSKVHSIQGYYRSSISSGISIRKYILEANMDYTLGIDTVSYTMFQSALEDLSITAGVFYDYSYNHTTKQFTILNPTEAGTTLYLKVYADISDSSANIELIYEDRWFQKYVEANIMLTWARNNYKFDRQILGNASVNWREILQEAKEDIEKLEEELHTNLSNHPFLLIG